MNQSIATPLRVARNCQTHSFISIMPFALQIVSHVLQCRMESATPSPSNFGNFSFGPAIITGCCVGVLFGFATPTFCIPAPTLCILTPTLCIPTPTLCTLAPTLCISTPTLCTPAPTFCIPTAVLFDEEGSPLSEFVRSRSISRTKSSLHARAPSALRAVQVNSLLFGFSFLGEYRFKNSSLASSTNSTRC